MTRPGTRGFVGHVATVAMCPPRGVWKIHASFPCLGLKESGYPACPWRRHGILWEPLCIPHGGVPLHMLPPGYPSQRAAALGECAPASLTRALGLFK